MIMDSKKSLSQTPNAIRNRAWYTRHAKEVCTAARKRYSANPDKEREKARSYYARNKVVVRLRTKAWKDTHPGLNSKLSWARHNKILLEKAGRPKPKICEACGAKNRTICFDHCHKNKVFRGWICGNCNSALGHVKDSIITLQKLCNYLCRNGNY